MDRLARVVTGVGFSLGNTPPPLSARDTQASSCRSTELLVVSRFVFMTAMRTRAATATLESVSYGTILLSYPLICSVFKSQGGLAHPGVEPTTTS